ncbi:MAG: amidohydrolase family protein [Thermoleophilaceae bacterium]|nr:amidohydrolase family protein [Thermoleophilaceae bacterium]
MYADSALRPWYDALRESLPGLRLFDAHTHTGASDPDGFACSVYEVAEALDLVDARGVVFTMQEPAGYSPANDRVLAEAAASEGKLVAVCRLDPHERPVAEAERCLAAGARGLKLHPRAEGFSLADPSVEAIFALAHERRLPIVIHAGRGIPALGRHVLGLAERFPDARPILAHAGVCDLAWIWRRLDDHPNVFFDTAWWSALDLLALFSLVPPGRILWGSDLPYGTPLQSAVLALRCALEAGLSPDQVAGVAGGQLERLLAGEEPLDAGPAPGAELAEVDLLLDRVHAALVNAIGRIMGGEGGEAGVGLARLACEVGEEAPQAPVCRSVLSLLDRYERHAATVSDSSAPAERFPSLHPLIVAAGVARTPRVALPPEPEPVAAGERSP